MGEETAVAVRIAPAIVKTAVAVCAGDRYNRSRGFSGYHYKRSRGARISPS